VYGCLILGSLGIKQPFLFDTLNMKTIDNFHDFFSEESLYIAYCDYIESKTDLFDPTKIEVPYESAEEIFGTICPDVSFAYRKKRSAPLTASRIWRSFKYEGFGWAFDADITKFFDSIVFAVQMHIPLEPVGRIVVLGLRSGSTANLLDNVLQRRRGLIQQYEPPTR
jgi:hypothetical protein